MTGVLMPIGGAEDKRANRVILTRFVQLCGANSARIIVIPSASSFPYESASTYEHLFSQIGAAQVTRLHIPDRQQANRPDYTALLQDATGVFFTGGDQLRLLSLIGGTGLAAALCERFASGLHIAGTSAGASAMSRQMIAFGRSGSAPSQRMVQMAAGLGLCDNLIIDQHFQQRNRLGRLMTAVTLNPGTVGVGIDEDTALLMTPDGGWEVLGSGQVTVVDGRMLEYTDIYAVKRYNPITVKGLQVHKLGTGIASIRHDPASPQPLPL